MSEFKKQIKFLLNIAILISLCACNTTTKKTAQEPEIDLFDLQTSATTAYDNGDMVESEKLYLQLTKRVAEEAQPWFRLGNVYAKTNRPGLAIQAYQEALVREPDLAKAWFNMGVLQLKMAANSFNELQIHVPTDDPLYDQGHGIFEGILQLLKGEQPN